MLKIEEFACKEHSEDICTSCKSWLWCCV